MLYRRTTILFATLAMLATAAGASDPGAGSTAPAQCPPGANGGTRAAGPPPRRRPVHLVRAGRNAVAAGCARDFFLTLPVQLAGQLAWILGESRHYAARATVT